MTRKSIAVGGGTSTVLPSVLDGQTNREDSIHPQFRAARPGDSIYFAVVVRNRIKRRLREALFLLLKEGKVKQTGFELAIIPKKEVADLDFSELAADLQSALKRLPKPARLAE